MKTNRLTIAALALTACAANTLHAYEPVSGQSSQPKATVVQKATLAVSDAGYETETTDGTTGIVISKWIQGSGIGQEDRRYRLRVIVDDSGHYEISAQCQGKDPGPLSSGAWVDNCTADKRPQFVLDAVAKVKAGLE